MVHFSIKGVLLQNDIWLSADHQTLLVMEQNRDWWVPNHPHRQKNALVGHDRSRQLRRAGGLCVALHRTCSAVKCPRSEVLAKQIAVQQHLISLEDIIALCWCCCDTTHYLVALHPEMHNKLGENVISISELESLS